MKCYFKTLLNNLINSQSILINLYVKITQTHPAIKITRLTIYKACSKINNVKCTTNIAHYIFKSQSHTFDITLCT